MFLIDGSDSITEDNWEVMKTSLINFIEKLEIAPDRWRVGLTQFSTDVEDHFYMNTYTNFEQMERAIRNISAMNLGTNTWKALRKVNKQFTSEQGSRWEEGIPQNLILITDGDAKDPIDLDALALLHAKNVEIFGILVESTNVTKLLQIVGSPEKLFVETFETLKLKTTTTKVLQAICERTVTKGELMLCNGLLTCLCFIRISLLSPPQKNLNISPDSNDSNKPQIAN